MVAKKTFFIEKKWKKEKIIANILEFPNFVQPNPYSCGDASALSILRYYGIENEREWKLEKILKTTPKNGTHLIHIMKLFTHHGFTIDAGKMTIADVEKYVDKGIPVLVMIQARSDKKKIDYAKTRAEWHYVVVIGYNKEYIFFDDPVLKNVGYMKKKEFISRWHDKDSDGEVYMQYGIAVYGKKPKYHSSLVEKID